MIRGLDHLVLPVSSLDIARQRYEALGFSVNKDGIHPFGTSNCCVFIENGVYLEPVAVYDEALAAQYAKQNSFVMLDAKFREIVGNDGLAALSLQTNDSEEDRKSFTPPYEVGAGNFEFSRKAIHPDGSEDTLNVALTFCMNPSSPAFGLFTCEWRGDPAVVAKIKTAPAHPNTVLATIGVDLVSNDIPNALAYLNHAFGAKFESIGNDRYALTTPNSLITLHKGDKPLQASSVTFSATSVQAVADCLEKAGIAFDSEEGTIVVAPAQGQGVTMKFTEKTTLA
ncbi:MAG: VOC family protein [Hyphomicrobiales bacterium]